MDRPDLVGAVFAALADGEAPQAARNCAARWEREGDPVAAALAAVTHFWLGEFVAGSQWGRRALEAATDDEARALALAAVALAAAGDLGADGRPDLEEGLALLSAASDPGSVWWSAVRYVLAEAALVTARIHDAARALATGPIGGAAWDGHPFSAVMAACAVRTALFGGDVGRARDLLAPMRSAVVPGTRLAVLTDSVAALVHGNADDAVALSGTLAAADAVRGADQRDFLDRGVLLLLAFGAIAVGDVATAGGMILRAGTDGDLSACTLIDRALGLELLLVAALSEDDLAAAEAWFAAMLPLATHPSSGPTVERARSRVLLALGDVAGAAAAARAGIDGCRADGRLVEAAEGEIVLARARIAGHDVAAASRALRALVSAADASGHHAVRRSASSTLQPARRRLPPVAGGGWSALSEREQEVARHVLRGDDVDQIAALLFLSPGTVRSHVSRVLCAFGVPTRIGLLAAVGTAPREVPRPPPAPLSPRQAEVVRRIAHGGSNQQIAAELGISVKGVEKHVGDVLARWGVRSRFEVARVWWDCDEVSQREA
jgi:DNA-binding NarL/FixJ family response regulator